VLQPTADAMVAEGCPFEGVLYGGLMKTPQGIKVIEFNARFGDPETEVVLPRLKSDIVDIFCAVADGGDTQLVWHDFATLGIVLASKGYPGAYEKGCEIKGLDRVEGALYTWDGRTGRRRRRSSTSGGRPCSFVRWAKEADRVADGDAPTSASRRCSVRPPTYVRSRGTQTLPLFPYPDPTRTDVTGTGISGSDF